ncbi:hypothetical protein ACTI_75490 [Actinoplanes sp. OR16]|nr:hypothetical protein ACTI_75490 [Actinoplanes sp. OR16]
MVDSSSANETRGIPPATISFAIHAKGKSALEVAREIAVAVGVDRPEQVGDLLLSLQGVHAFTVVVDALDEARTSDEARSIAQEILRPLAESRRGTGSRILLGARRRDDQGDLLKVLGPGSIEIDLDRSENFELEDLVAYALMTLRLARDEEQNPYRNSIEAESIARRIATIAAPNFLVAGLVARTHGLYDTTVVSPEDVVFDGSVEDAFRRYLRRVPPIEGLGADQVLAGLAFAEVPGLPVELWCLAIETQSGHALHAAALRRFSRTAAGNFIIEFSDSGSETSFRLYHQALNDTLIAWRAELGSSAVEDERSWTRALVDFGRRVGWSNSPRYLLQSLPTHAERAGLVDELLTDTEVVLYADMSGLLAVSDRAQSREARAIVRLIRLTPNAFEQRAAERIASFSVVESLEGLGTTFRDFQGVEPPYRGIWAEVDAREQSAVLEGHAGGWVNSVSAAEFAGKQVLVSASDDGVVNVWSLQDRNIVKNLRSFFTAHLIDLQYVASLGYLVTIWGSVYYCDIRTAEGSDRRPPFERLELSGKAAKGRRLCVWEASGEAVLAVAGEDGALASWDLFTRVKLADYPAGNRDIDSVCAMRLSGRPVLVAGSRDGFIRVFDLYGGDLSFELSGHRGGVDSLIGIDTDHGAFLASGGADRKVRIWDLASRRVVKTSAVLPGRIHRILDIPGRPILAVLAGDCLFYVSSRTTEIMEENRSIGVHRAFGGACVVREHGKYVVATADISGSVRIWNVPDERADAEPQSSVVMSNGILAIGSDSSRDSPIFWVKSKDALTAREIATGGVVKKIPADSRYYGKLKVVDNFCVVAEGSDVNVYNTFLRDIWVRIEAPHQVTALDSRKVGGDLYVVTGDYEGNIIVWNASRRQVVTDFNLPKKRISSVCITVIRGEACVAATTMSDSSVRAWNVNTGKQAARLRKPKARVKQLAAITLAGTAMMAGSDIHGYLNLWPEEGAGFSVPTGHESWINDVCGVRWGSVDCVATAGHDRTVRLIDPVNRKALAVIPVHREPESLSSPSPGRLVVRFVEGILGLEFTEAGVAALETSATGTG